MNRKFSVFYGDLCRMSDEPAEAPEQPAEQPENPAPQV